VTEGKTTETRRTRSQKHKGDSDIKAMEERLRHYERKYGLHSSEFIELYHARRLQDEDPAIREYWDTEGHRGAQGDTEFLFLFLSVFLCVPL